MRTVIALAFALAAGPALAQTSLPLLGTGGGTAAPPGFTGLGDVVAMTAYHSCARAYTAAYAAGNGKLCNLKDSTTTHTCDVLAASTGLPGNTANCSTGGDNGQALATWIGADTLTIAILKEYNQVANGTLDLGLTGAVPALRTLGGKWCALSPGGSGALLSSDTNAAAQPVSLLVVSQATVGTQGVMYGFQSGGAVPQIGSDATGANAPYAYAGALLTDTGADNALHLMQAVFNGGSSSFAVDNRTTVTGSLGAGSPAGVALGLNESTPVPFTGWICEGAFKSSAWSGANITAIHSNVAAFWGTP